LNQHTPSAHSSLLTIATEQPSSEIVTTQQALNYICSCGRAATMEAQSLERQHGLDQYYQQWLQWMKLEVVCSSMPSVAALSNQLAGTG
jgi:hypothetical protein